MVKLGELKTIKLIFIAFKSYLMNNMILLLFVLKIEIYK